MWRIRRFHVDSLGVRDNRFVDVTVDLTGTDGEPADSIVWLRNGAGKTTMLSLLIAHILPNRGDFLARRSGKQRTLEDLVLSGDTGHVACEWVNPSGVVLLTGAVYEWTGRSRPRDYNTAEGRQAFHRRFWIVRSDETVDGATFDELPFFTRSGGRVDLAAFAEHVRDLARIGVDAVVEDSSIAQWHAALTQRHFDPELFRYFATVNGTEGGLEQLFDKIDSPASFARFLLQFVANPERAIAIKRLLDDTAAEIARRPAYQADQTFCLSIAPLLDQLGSAHETVTVAETRLAEAQSMVAVLRRDLLDAVDRSELEAAGQADRAKEATARYQRVARERSRQRRLAENLRWVAAEFDHSDALAAAKAATAHLIEARRAVKGWEALDVLVDRDRATAT